MDPNETLSELRSLAREVTYEPGNDFEVIVDAARMAELFSALDEWLSRGGFLPADWQAKR